MSNRTLMTLLSLALVAISVLFFTKIAPFMNAPAVEKYISPGDLKASAVVHKSLPYTLNFEQQTALVTYLNQAIPVGSAPFKTDPNLPYTKIILYRFNSPSIELTPITRDGNDLIFSSPTWNPNGYLRDVSYGQLIKLLDKTFDP